PREVPDSLRANKGSKVSELDELVFVLEGNKVKSRKIKPGIQDNTYIEILSGLQAGEQVITAPYRVVNKKLKDDMEVEVVPKDQLYTQTGKAKKEEEEE
ncbi:MAG TPA: hypothetical protein PK715_01475, partial [Chitinophagales bacterium]|nr:hypothetical protein [Chitinophagales bacterium]